MPDSKLTLMVIHAHPDDEATSTGGILHHYSEQGVETILVTCTGGELGDGPGGIKPDQEGHDEQLVRSIRRGELAESCRVLGVSHLELLGYLDSGMVGWPQNHRARSLAGTSLDEELQRLLPLVERYHPQVMVSYDETGGYGHPDHIRVHELARAATVRSGIPAKLYYTAFPKSVFKQAMAAAASAGIALDQLPPLDFDPDNPPFGVDDELITTTVDVAEDVPAKMAALAAHASQVDNAFLLNLPRLVVQNFMSREHFIRALDSTGASLPESDLFAGLR
ncbi:MAG: PIG-L family deacetylase [Candidatus Dormibacteria bacterium]